MNNRGRLSLHFEGDIVSNHLISARTLGKSLIHTQNAIDRAFLDLKYGNLWKYARMKGEDYPYTDFTAMYPQEGGFIQDLVSNTGKNIINRIADSLTPAMENILGEGEEVASSIYQQVQDRKNHIELGVLEPRKFQDIVDNPDEKVTRSYADRSINREINQLLTIIRSRHAGESFVEITTEGTNTFNFQFNKFQSTQFHKLISRKEVGSPVVYTASVRKLDRDSLNGKIINLENNKNVAIHFMNTPDLGSIKK